jgi:hypothetical protein
MRRLVVSRFMLVDVPCLRDAAVTLTDVPR